MSTDHQQIIQLDTQLANQIAAGEVVERPASVVKELLENSLDAGATVIDVEIINGGKQLIRIRDNGRGIAKEQLHLALAPHATSKIRTLDDLEALRSYGFRGEALASISSVSKFSLTSRTAAQEQGWCAISEGVEMVVNLSPAPATEGTRIDVEELFYNTPARRRFLRTDKTEFAQIETVLRQVALANPHVALSLKHNQRLVKRYKAAFEPEIIEQRLAVACGTDFVKQSIRVDVSYDELKLSGWIGLPSYHRSQTDGQFFFVNHRPVKDKVLGHALREAYHPHIPEGRSSAYVLFLEMPPEHVDVNVHPTKHEVRFHDVRTIHDFIVQAIEQCLHQGLALVSQDHIQEEEINTQVGQDVNHQLHSEIQSGGKQQFESYSAFIADAYRSNLSEQSLNYADSTDLNKEVFRISEQLLLLNKGDSVVLVDINKTFGFWFDVLRDTLKVNKMLFPVPVKISSEYRSNVENFCAEHNVEITDVSGQLKIMSAPDVWNIDKLGEQITDYVLFANGHPERMSLNWVSSFIDKYEYQLATVLHYKTTQELENFFAAPANRGSDG